MKTMSIAFALIILGEMPNADAVELQPAASMLDVSGLQSPVPLPQLIGSLTPIAHSNTANGIEIRVFSMTDKVGECANSSGAPVGENARTCPRVSLLISTVLGLEGGTKYKLYKTSPRLDWRMVDTTLPTAIIPEPYHGKLVACEASIAVDRGQREGTPADRWHYVEYELMIADYDKVKLKRLPDTGKYQWCDPGAIKP